MSDQSNDPTVTSTPAPNTGTNTPLEPSDTGTQSTVALSGVAAAADAGSVSALAPTSGAGVPPAPAPAAALYGREPNAVDYTPVRSDVIEQVKSELDDMERQCLTWGGEVGVQLRNSVCRVRLLLVGQ